MPTSTSTAPSSSPSTTLSPTQPTPSSSLSSPASSLPSSSSSSPATTPLRPIFYTLLLACPILALLPPRKLDLYTFSLAGAWVVSAEEVGFGARIGGKGGMGAGSVGERWGWGRMGRRREMGEEMGEEGGGEEGTHFYKHNHDTNAKDREDATDAKDADEDGGEGIKGLARKLWMGDEKPGWQGRRLKKEKEELEKGVGYGGIIMGQVREVFGGREDGEGEGGKREG